MIRSQPIIASDCYECGSRKTEVHVDISVVGDTRAMGEILLEEKNGYAHSCPHKKLVVRILYGNPKVAAFEETHKARNVVTRPVTRPATINTE
mmetsp:Transcript_916/g.1496  ORF Transcript_916/g.1496 Transcript_916/m.1496 type:complete len:93 (+) Transcript_916:280-558(+)